MSQPSQDNRRFTIMAVDDNPENLQLINGLLKERFRVKTLPDGLKALAVADSDQPPDLILLDVVMPHMDGLEVCRRLRENPRTCSIPVIFLTAKHGSEHELAGLTIGAVDYLSKPIVPELLKARINLHLELYEARRQLAAQNRSLNESMQLREEIERLTRHDLKGPLSGVITMSDLLIRDENLSQHQRNSIETINRAGYRILEMIDRSLDLYKMETGRYHLNADAIDLIPTLYRVWRDQQRRAERQGQQLVLRKNAQPVTSEEENFFVWGEELLLYSMLSNLVTNAIDASPPGSNLTIDLDERQQERLITLHNHGEVPTEIRHNFFDKYVTSGKKQGTGLGTYSAKLIATTHGGDITMTSSSPQGTHITIRLHMKNCQTAGGRGRLEARG